MKKRRAPDLTSAAKHGHSRRGALPRAGIAFLGLAAAPGLGQARKGKGKGKGRRKRRCRNTIPPVRIPTCEEHCFPDFLLCFERAEGPPLCANGAFTDGSVKYSTDQECLGDRDKPYCLVSSTERDTGDTSRFPTCEPYAEGCCIYAGIFP